jgi:hypothetical protein
MYVIAKWNETFENADTRKRVRLGWFLCPSGVESAGYIELMSYGEDGIKAFAVFLAICQWSATCLPHVRGKLARSSGKPADERQIAASLRMPIEVVRRSLEILCHPEIGWIEKIGDSETIEKHKESTESASHLPPICQSSAGHLPQGEGEGEGEGKGKGKDRRASRPDDISNEVWEAWIKHRKTKKASVSDLVIDRMRIEAEKAGVSLSEAMQESVLRGWTGFKADWVGDSKKKEFTY